MSKRSAHDLDAALEALARAERAAGPAVSERLRARVLADAAQVSPGQQDSPARSMPAMAGREYARHGMRPGERHDTRHGGRGRRGWRRGVDLWTGAAAAAAILCLAIGLGVGYGAGERLLAEIGFEDVRLAQAQAEDELAFLEEGVL